MEKVDLSRRQFLAASAAAGFALAVLPVSADTIITGGEGLSAGDVEIPTADRSIPAYRAMPSSGGPFAVILVVHEIFSVHEYIRDVCRRLAKQGYLAIAPDLYARQGDVRKLPDVREIVTKVVARVPDAQVMSDLDATAAWVKKQGHGDGGRMGVTGFCWGGRITWLYCAHNPTLDAGVAWYGRLVGDDSSALQPKDPIDLVGSLHCPVLGLYGGADAGIPQDTVERMRAALKAAGKKAEIVVYPGAAHGFHADYRPSYNRAAAEDGWRRLLAWFRDHGVA